MKQFETELLGTKIDIPIKLKNVSILFKYFMLYLFKNT